MSHIVKYTVGIHNLETLRGMCERIGLELHEDTKEFRAYYGTSPCAHMISLPGNPEGHYQIGLTVPPKDNEAAGFGLNFDAWSTGLGVPALKEIAGPKMEKLQFEYLHQCAIETAQEAGGTLSMSESPDAWLFEIDAPDAVVTASV